MTDDQIEMIMLGIDEVLVKLQDILAVLQEEALNLTKEVADDNVPL